MSFFQSLYPGPNANSSTVANNAVPNFAYSMAADRVMMNGGAVLGHARPPWSIANTMPIFSPATTITAAGVATNPMIVAATAQAGTSFLSGMGLTPITFANTTISAAGAMAAAAGSRMTSGDPMLVFSTGIDATK